MRAAGGADLHSRFAVAGMLLVDDDGWRRDGLVEAGELREEVGGLAAGGGPASIPTKIQGCRNSQAIC